MDKNFGGVIWTNHAISRMQERGIKQGDAWATWRNPDQSRRGTSNDTWVYYKTYDDSRIEVVAKKIQSGEWIILSVWSKLVNGTYPNVSKNDSFLGIILKKIFPARKK